MGRIDGGAMTTIFTRRYVSNLLQKGRNNEFTIIALTRNHSMVEELVVGYYYLVTVSANGSRISRDSVGATPLQAVENCLAKHGVKFR